jgi:hypothetical protein
MATPMSNSLTPRYVDAAGELRRASMFKPLSEVISQLRSKYGLGRLWIDPQPFAKSRDPLIFEKMQRDGVIAKAVQYRQHQIATAEYRFVAPDSESRELIPYFEALFRHCQNLHEGRMHLTHAIFEGIAWTKMFADEATFGVGVDKTGQSNPPIQWTVPVFAHVAADAIRRDVEKRKIKPEDGPEREVDVMYWSTYNMQSHEWLRVEKLENYLRLTYNDSAYTLGYGRGLIDAIWYYWYIKTQLLEKMLVGADKFAQPWIHIAIDLTMFHNAAGGGPGYGTPEEMAAQLYAIFEKMRSGNIVITDSNAKVTPLDFSGTAAEGLAKLIEYCDRVLTELILGSSRPFGGGGPQGSYASAEVEKDSSIALMAYDLDLHAIGLNQLVWALWRWNMPNFHRLQSSRTGRPLSVLKPPFVKLDRKRFASTMEAATVGARVLNSGAPLIRSEYYAQTGWTEPWDLQSTDILQPPGVAIDPATGLPLPPMLAAPGAPGAPGAGTPEAPGK